jgi:hypothetical protein
MKHTIEKDENHFIPITLTLKIESQAELDALTTIADNRTIGDALEGAGMVDPFSGSIAGSLKSAGGRVFTTVFLESLVEKI